MRHHFTLHHLTSEISEAFHGAILTDCYTQEKNTVVLQFEKDSEILCLEYAMQPGNSAFYRKDAMRRANRNSASLFPELIGRACISCTVHPFDRIVYLQCTGAQLISQFYGGSNTALFAIDEHDCITSVFKRAPAAVGEIYVSGAIPYKTLETLPKEMSLIEAIAKSHEIGKLYANEVMMRYDAIEHSSFDYTMPLKDIPSDKIEAIENIISQIIDECFHSATAFILKTAHNQYELSCIPLLKYPEIIGQYTLYSDAIRKLRGLKFVNQTFLQQYNALENRLQSIIRKTRRSIEHLQENDKSTKRSDRSSLIGTLLLSEPYPALRINKDHIVLAHDGEIIELKVDPRKTYAELAQEYFKKAQSSKEAQSLKKEFLPGMILKLEKVQSALRSMSTIRTIHELTILQQSLHQILQTKEKKQTNASNSQFREFALSKEYTLYIGKNSLNNDELTLHFAKPNDTWMHARGVSGSHAVLRGKSQPPKNILEMAAQITAYFSQARNATYTPVSYTLKKYVRKPKKSAPGSVIMEREEVIMVTPHLPAHFKQAFSS